jgi:hypothetical protein
MAATNYKAAFFKHWINLTFLAATVGAALAVDWKLGVAGLLVEGAALWVLPEFKSIQSNLDAGNRMAKIENQRRYYVKMLWKVEVPTGNFLFRQSPDWTEATPPYSTSEETRIFQRMITIVNSLRELQKMHTDQISENEILRMEELINRWMELQYLVRNIDDTLRQIDRRALAAELARLEQTARTAGNDRTARIVLAERFRTLKRKAESIPRHERKKGLWLAQAESIVQRMEEINTNIRTAGVSDAGFLMDFSAFDTMDDSLFENAEASSEVRDLSMSGTGDLNLDDPEMWGSLRQQLGVEEVSSVVDEVVAEIEPVPSRRRAVRTARVQEEENVEVERRR